MELGELKFCALIIVLLLCVLILVLYMYITWTHSLFKKIGVPGPEPKLLGILLDYKKKGVINTDMELFAKYGRVVGVYYGREPVLLLSDPDMFKEICIRKFNNFINRSKTNMWLGDILQQSLVVLEEDHWKRSRSILSPTFSSSKIRNMAHLIDVCLHRLIAAIRIQGDDGRAVEIRKVAECFTMDVIASIGFGMDVDPYNHPEAGFVKNARNAMKFFKHPILTICLILPFMYHVFRFFNFAPVSQAAQDFFYKAVTAAIKDRAGHQKRADLLQLMINAHTENAEWHRDLDPDTKFEYTVSKGQAFTEKEILAHSMFFIIAGYDTTSSLITFACHQLAVNTQCQERLRAEIISNLGQQDKPTCEDILGLKYLDNVINETLRLYPPVIKINRLAKNEITIKGLTIPSGVSIIFPTYSIHHDPELWTDPETFDPDRFSPENRTWPPYAFVPFGAGPRNCIGMRLGLLEAKKALISLVRNFDIQCAPGTEVRPKLGKYHFTRPENPLYLRFLPLQ